MSEIEKAAADVLIGGYAILIVVLAWVWITYRSRHRAYKEGYEHGFEKGERLGYERYGAEIEGVMGNAIGAAYHAARTRRALTPQADWRGSQGATRERPTDSPFRVPDGDVGAPE